MSRIRNRILLGITGLGAASAMALGPAQLAHASPPTTPTATTTTAAAAAPAAAPAEQQLHVDGALQPNGYYCGPAATRIALSAHGSPPSFDALAKDLGTTSNGTASIDDITRVLNERHGGYQSVKFDSTPSPAQVETLRTDVSGAINDGDPVVANIIGQVTDNQGETHSYTGGHYLTITGYSNDAHTVTITDPADTKGANTYQLSVQDMAGWMATRGYTH